MKILALIALLGTAAYGQHGMTGLATNPHPRIYWNDSGRLTAAQAYYVAHPWTVGSYVIDYAEDYLGYCYAVPDTSYCTAAKDLVVNYVLTHGSDSQAVALQTCLSALNAASDCGSDRMRYYGQVVMHVLDGAWSYFSGAERRLVLDRWLGATVDDTDPPHVVTDAAVGAGSTTITSASGPFLANMAGNNMVVVTAGGTNCTSPTGETNFAIVSVTNSTTAIISSNFNTSASSGCHISIEGYFSITERAPWGAANQPYSNYNRAFTRNDFMSVAAYGHTAFAPPTLDNWETRFATHLAYQNGTTPYTTNSMQGGMMPEGIEYGLQSFLYEVMPLFVARDYGRNLTAESNWYKESVFFYIYNRSLKATSDQKGNFYYQQLPWDDDSTNNYTIGYNGSTLAESVVSMLGQLFGSTKVGKWAREFVNTTIGTGIMPTPWFADPLPTTLALSALPLDYYAGAGISFFKNSWASDGMQFKSMAAWDRGGHSHIHPGDWWIVRNAYRMAGGFSTYGSQAIGQYLCAGTGYDGQLGDGTCDILFSAQGNNTVAFAPGTTTTNCQVGEYIQDDVTGTTTNFRNVLRLESKPTYAYVAEDISTAFYNGEIFGDTRACGRNNPYAKTPILQKIMVKPLNLMLFLYRLESQYAPTPIDTLHPVQTAAQVRKIIYVHTPTPWTIASNVASADNDGVERIKVWAFTSESAINLAQVDEGNFASADAAIPYPQRLEISASGTAQTYMLLIVKVGDISGWTDPTTVSYDNSTRTLTYNSAAGNLLFSFGAGAQPTGEMIGYAASGTPTLAAMTSTVNPPTVNDNGPVWPGGGAGGGTTRGGKVTVGGKVIQ